MSKHTPFLNGYIISECDDKESITKYVNGTLKKISEEKKSIENLINSSSDTLRNPSSLSTTLTTHPNVSISKVNELNIVKVDDILNAILSINKSLSDINDRLRKLECK